MVVVVVVMVVMMSTVMVVAAVGVMSTEAVVTSVVMVAAVAGAIRAGFRLEGAHLERHRQPELTHHAVQDVIMLVGETAQLYLQRDVTVAQVVRGAKQRQKVIAVHHRELFRGCSYQGDRTVLRAQPVTLLERRSTREEHSAVAPGVEARSETTPAAEVPRHRERFPSRLGGLQELMKVNHAKIPMKTTLRRGSSVVPKATRAPARR